MKIQGIEFTKDEIDDFQKRFLGSAAASAIGKVLEMVMAEASQRLEDTRNSMETIRQAQGMVEAIRFFDMVTTEVGKANLDEDTDTGEDKQTDEEGIDVRF